MYFIVSVTYALVWVAFVPFVILDFPRGMPMMGVDIDSPHESESIMCKWEVFNIYTGEVIRTWSFEHQASNHVAELNGRIGNPTYQIWFDYAENA